MLDELVEKPIRWFTEQPAKGRAVNSNGNSMIPLWYRSQELAREVR